MIGAILAVPLLWWKTHWWVALLWVVAYVATEGWVSSVGDRRTINGFTAASRIAKPEASQEELQRQALDLLDSREKALAESGEYL